MNSYKITYKNLAILFSLFFVIRGISQLLFSIKLLSNTLVLHIASSSLLIFLFAVFLNNLKKRKNISSSHVLLVFSTSYFIATSFIRGHYFNFTDFISYVTPLFAFIGLFEIRKYINYGFIVKIVLAVFVFQTLYLILTNGIVGIIARSGRDGLGSLFGHANSLALIAASFFIAIQHNEAIKNFKSNLLLRNFSLLMMIAIIGARSMLLSLIVGYLYVLISRERITTRSLSLMAAIYTLLIFVIVLYGLSLINSEWDVQSYLSGNSLKWRIIHWQYYLYELSELDKVLFGYGVGAHELVTNGLYYKYLEVHNDFVRITYDVGIIGIFIYISFDYVITKLIRTRVKVDWRYYLILANKYFFMFFDNYAANMFSILGMTLVLLFYVTNLERFDGKPT